MKIVQVTLSDERLGPYLIASGHDLERAALLYVWNLEVSAAFYPLLSVTEVGLRNCTVRGLSRVYGPAWWTSNDFHQLLGSKGTGMLRRSERELKLRRRPITSGRLTAELSFGFWANMYLPKYEKALWPTVKGCFASLPQTEIEQSTVYELSSGLRKIRNRISHHETLLGRDLTKEFSNILKLLGWVCPETHDWIRPQLRVMSLLRARP